jgi:4-amino-4-deoxy-L-arabinose transferase-like glycosyltransferase
MLSRSDAPSDMERSVLSRYAPLIAAFVVSRMVIVAAALVVEAGLVLVNPRLTHGDPAPILRSLTTWDGDWFVGIARDGYHVEAFGDTGYHDYAFFPLYPMLVRVLALPWPNLVGLIAVVLNLVLLAIALVLLVRLARPHLGESRAIRAAALLALFPFSFVFSMAYSETLTLVLIVASFLAVERGIAGRAGVFFGLASLTRAQSASYLFPLLLASRLRGPRRWRWLALGLGPLATLSYIVWVAFFTGSPNGYFGSYAAWGRNTGGVAAGSGSVGEAISGPLAYYFITLMVLLAISVGLFVFARTDKIPIEYLAIPAISLVTLLVSGSLEAVGRIVLLSFPYSWILASRQHPAWRYGWPVLSVAFLAYFSTLTFAGWWIP